MVNRRALGLLLVVLLTPGLSPAADFAVQLPMTRADSGSYYVEGSFAGRLTARFLVDTGAGMSVVEHELLDRLRDVAEVTLSRRIAARLANGAIEAINVYRIDGFTVGTACEIGALEVAVMPGGGNILGLNALERLAPFAVHVSPPSLAVSHCGDDGLLAMNP